MSSSIPRLTPERISPRVPPSSAAQRPSLRAGEQRPSRPSPARPWRSCSPSPGDRAATSSSIVDQSRPRTERHEEVVEDVPAGLGRLGAVIRVGRAGALAPADDAVAADAHQDVVEVVSCGWNWSGTAGPAAAGRASGRSGRFAFRWSVVSGPLSVVGKLRSRGGSQPSATGLPAGDNGPRKRTNDKFPSITEELPRHHSI